MLDFTHLSGIIEVGTKRVPESSSLLVKVSHTVPQDVRFTRMGNLNAVGDSICEHPISMGTVTAKGQDSENIDFVGGIMRVNVLAFK